MKQISEIKNILSSPKKIIITTHHKPDGDAMGSSLGIFNSLKLKGHNVTIITPTDYPDFLHWLPGNEHVIIFENNITKSKKLIEQADLIFCLDFNKLHRINELGKLVADSKAKKILIDHHLNPDKFADYEFHNHHASSTAELVYDFLLDVVGKDIITKQVADCLYVGMMTDTGSFRFSSTTAKVHRIVSDLIEIGIDVAQIHQHIFDSFTEDRLRFIGYCISEKMQIFKEYNTALISITQAELKKYNSKTGDTEGVVNFPLGIHGIKFAALIVDRKQAIKLSLRSKGDFPANEIAEKYFNGGGHKNAAGGHSNQNLDEVIQKFISILPEYKNQLTL